MSKPNIASVGVDIPSLGDKYLDIYSLASLSPYDIIIFRPYLSSHHYSYIEFRNGGIALDGDGYKDLIKQTKHWNLEISDALKQKKTVFVLTVANKEIRYATGYTSPRKGEKTYNTGSMDLYSCILPYPLRIRVTNGDEIFVCKNDIMPITKQLYDSCKEQTAYEVIFTDIEKTCQPLLETKSKQIVGFIKNFESGGRLIFWPNIDFEYEGSTYEDEEKEYEEFWTDDAIAMSKAFIAGIVSFYKSLHNIQEPMPTWVSSETYMTNGEKDILKKIQGNQDKQKKLEIEVTKLNEKLQQEQYLKHLLYAQGKELEDAVNYALGLLGLKVKNYRFQNKDFEIDNLVDYNGGIIIGETEGKDSNAIAVDKIRQLVSNKDEYYMEKIEESAIEPKGVLFGNSERLKPLEERTLDFTDACKQISASKKIALVRTQDLFNVALYMKNNPNKVEFANRCIEAMVNTESGIVHFPRPD